jgi:iturin family lipopeptide synthetase B
MNVEMTSPEIEDVYRLSSLQQGLLFHALISPQERFYVDQVVYRLDGELVEPAFRRTWAEVVERHSMLRTSFHWDGLDELVQVVHRHCERPGGEARGLPARGSRARVRP